MSRVEGHPQVGRIVDEPHLHHLSTLAEWDGVMTVADTLFACPFSGIGD